MQSAAVEELTALPQTDPLASIRRRGRRREWEWKEGEWGNGGEGEGEGKGERGMEGRGVWTWPLIVKGWPLSSVVISRSNRLAMQLNVIHWQEGRSCFFYWNKPTENIHWLWCSIMETYRRSRVGGAENTLFYGVPIVFYCVTIVITGFTRICTCSLLILLYYCYLSIRLSSRKCALNSVCEIF